MSRYELELDIPYPVLEEEGWAKARLLRDVKAESELLNPNLMLERKTGTLLLRPVQLDPEAWVKPDTNALRIHLESMYHAPNYWQEHDMPSLMSAPPGTEWPVYRSGGFSLVELLSIMGIAALESAILAEGMELIPVLATKEIFPRNQGFWIELETYGTPGLFARDHVAIRFGDFKLSLHSHGGADLYWSADKSCSANSWVLRKRFSTPDVTTKHVSITDVGTPNYSRIHILIIPFGRGNIWVRLMCAGSVFNGIYSHAEAEWNSGEGRYHITEPGMCCVYVPKNAQKNIGVQISKIGYATYGEWDDTLFEIPYAPTTNPSSNASWVRTQGTPDAALSLLDDTGGGFASNGINRKLKARLSLSGDGSCTPWVDSYTIQFAEKSRMVTPAKSIVVPNAAITNLSIADGEKWEDQKLSINLRVKRDNAELLELCTRTEIVGRLSIDDSAYMTCRFSRPKVALGKTHHSLILTGANFGAATVDEKNFGFAPPFGDWTHPEAVAKILKLCGYPSEYIITDSDTIKLPGTKRHGAGTDKGETEIASQPQFNSAVRSFLSWITDNFSRWPLLYGADMIWRYQQPTTPTTAIATFVSKETFSVGSYPLWAEAVTVEAEPPDANYIEMYGQTDTGEVIGNTAYDPASIAEAVTDKPLNYLARRKKAIFIDKDLNTQEVLDTVLAKIAGDLSKAIFWVTWKGPFAPQLRINDAVTVEGVGLVQVKSITAEAANKRQLEKSASTVYSGRLLYEGA